MVCAELGRLGWNVSNTNFNAPVVVLQRIFQPDEIRSHQKVGRLVITDTNDLLAARGTQFFRPSEEESLAAADYVVVPCQHLRALYSRINPRTFIIPDTLEDEHWMTPRAELPNNPLILSWLGLGDCLQYMEPMVHDLGPVPDLRLRIITSERDSKRRSNHDRVKAWPIPVDFVEWRLETFACEMAQAHGGLVILPDTGFCRSKGQHKVVGYQALGMPCIASNMPGYREVIKHGETGFLCDTPQQFREAIEVLRDPEVRRRIGEAGREFSLHFQRPVIGKLWDRLLRGVLEH